MLVALLLPVWGLVMILLGLKHAMWWWLVTGVVVLGIGVTFFAGSPFVPPFLGGRRLS